MGPWDFFQGPSRGCSNNMSNKGEKVSEKQQLVFLCTELIAPGSVDYLRFLYFNDPGLQHQHGPPGCRVP